MLCTAFKRNLADAEKIRKNGKNESITVSDANTSFRQGLLLPVISILVFYFSLFCLQCFDAVGCKIISHQPGSS